MEPLISVIVPVYKSEPYLSRCIESIILQSYKNIQIILVDDGSPDNSGKICEEYAEMDNRITVIHKENGGLSDARNKGIDVAKGEYITFVDSDDYISLNFVKVLYECIKQNQADISVCKTTTFSGKYAPANEPRFELKVFNKKRAIETMLLQREFTNSANGKLFAKKFFLSNRFTKGILYEDFDLIFDLVDLADKVVFCSEAEYYYYINQDGIMHENIDKRHFVLIDIAKRVMDEFSKKYPTLKKQAYSRYIFSVFFISDKIVYSNKQSEFSAERETFRTEIKKDIFKILKNKYIKLPLKVKAVCFSVSLGFYETLLKIKSNRR